ncbi:hypothetical protein D3C71_1484560 [compost metagenome]
MYRSSNACVGCSPGPSPAFITGTWVARANSATAPFSGWRTTIASAYPLTTRLVSYRDSPFAIEEKVKPVVFDTAPPRRQNAASKLMRVRVLASKNRLARTAPSSTRVTFLRRAIGSSCSASAMRESTSCGTNWSMLSK